MRNCSFILRLVSPFSSAFQFALTIRTSSENMRAVWRELDGINGVIVRLKAEELFAPAGGMRVQGGRQ
jgi:hypothetical protein